MKIRTAEELQKDIDAAKKAVSDLSLSLDSMSREIEKHAKPWPEFGTPIVLYKNSRGAGQRVVVSAGDGYYFGYISNKQEKLRIDEYNNWDYLNDEGGKNE